MSIPVLLLFFNCSSDVDIQTVEMQPPLTDVLTLELTFGDEKTITKDEFLLAQPLGIAVSPAGDIVVSDETRLKVFDGNGTPKKIVGRYGQGPGEFRLTPSPRISNSGYLAALEGMPAPKEINLFSKEYNFIKRMNMRNYAKLKNLLNKDNATLGGVRNIILLSENEIVYSVYANLMSGGTSVYKNNYLVYDINDTLIVLAKYRTETQYRDISTGLGVPKPFAGSFFCAELPERKVVFTQSEYDETVENDNYTFTMTITSLDDFTSEKIVQKYVPVAIPDSIKKQYDEVWDKRREKTIKIMQRHVKNTTYYHHVTSLETDGNYIFVFTHKKNELGHTLADVFDAATKKRISSAYFSFIPYVIKDGYAYKISDYMRKNEFPEIEKYRIAPAVYGK